MRKLTVFTLVSMLHVYIHAEDYDPVRISYCIALRCVLLANMYQARCQLPHALKLVPAHL